METTTESTKRIININRPCYITFSLIGIIFILGHNFSQAAVFVMLALVFDPFDTKMSFYKRPIYQQAWLIVHLTIAIILFILMFYFK